MKRILHISELYAACEIAEVFSEKYVVIKSAVIGFDLDAHIVHADYVGCGFKTLYAHSFVKCKVRLHAAYVKADVLPGLVALGAEIRYPEKLVADRVKIV